MTIPTPVTHLPIILIIAGYVALIATSGWIGVGLAAVHIGAMVAAAAVKKSQQR